MTNLLLSERIERRIHLIRGHKVMLDSDLADLYEVETGALKRAVKRNQSRFPADFMFQLSRQEYDSLRCQSGILDTDSDIDSSPSPSSGRGRYSKYLPSAFTELDDLEQKYDAQFAEVFNAIRQIMEPPPSPRKPIGFTPKDQEGITQC